MRGPILFFLFVLTASLAAQTTATINIQRAVTSCQEGIRESQRIRANWEAPLAALVKREAEINAEREALERESKRRHGVWPFRRAMSAKEKARRSHEIDVEARAVTRQRDDDRAGFEAERQRAIAQIGSRMIPIVESYAKEHGYSLVLDSSRRDGPVVVALNDITDAIVTLMDRSFPAK
jgi:Skp family chaperone for outer membrane proteins